jgi:RND family efflux transporter, MFP subunit
MTIKISLPLRIALAALPIIFLGSCGNEPQAEETEEVAAQRSDLGEVQISPELYKKLKIGQFQWAQVADSMRVTGRVEADETRIARISAPVSGRITELEVIEGQTVKRGDLIAVIRSVELSNAQSSFLRALSQQQLAARAVTRAKQLLDADVIGSAELQRRQAELEQATADLASASEQLKVLGMTDEGIAALKEKKTVNSVVPVYATITGTVLERRVTIGQVVQAAEIVAVLADLSHVWLVADVPEQTAGSLAVGKEVKAEIAALPGHEISGTLSFVSAIVNPETRTVRARMNLPNPDRKYKPAMLATMTLQENAERQRLIPSTAVVRENNEDYLFVQTGPLHFAMRKVRLGDEIDGMRRLEDGVRPGEKIVLDGAFHLNNERKQMALRGK